MDQKHITAEIIALKSLLVDTDDTVNKLIEDLVLTMQSATATNFISKFVAWIKTAISTYGETVQKRAAWRDRINELEAMLTEEDKK